MTRAYYIGAPQFHELNAAARLLVDAYGYCVYLVGSSQERRDFRDVDVRVILRDADFDRAYPRGGGYEDPLWALHAIAISTWLSKRTELPIDFQVQRQTNANAEFDGPRNALGIFHPLTEQGPAPVEQLARARLVGDHPPPSTVFDLRSRCTCSAEMGSYDANVVLQLKDRKPFSVDACIASEIALLQLRGIDTIASCCGHRRILPSVCVAPESAEAMVALGYRSFEGAHE